MNNLACSFFVMIVAAFLFLAPARAENDMPENPFHFDVSTLSVEAKQSVDEATVDYQSVVAGKHPVYAKIDKEVALPTDGGTTFWKGKGYSLTVAKSLTSVGGVTGYMYGPVINFDEDDSNHVSRVEFYSHKDFERLQKGVKD